MKGALQQLDKVELINLQRLAHLLKSLSPTEVETLELLLDEEAMRIIKTSVKELDEGQSIPLDEW